MWPFKKIPDIEANEINVVISMVQNKTQYNITLLGGEYLEFNKIAYTMMNNIFKRFKVITYVYEWIGHLKKGETLEYECFSKNYYRLLKASKIATNQVFLKG